MTAHGLVGRLALALGATGLVLAPVELHFRQEEGSVRFPADEPGRGFSTAPYAHGTNSEGFHEREIPPGHPPGMRRVAVLGDSMTYGTTTPEETWTRFAEEALGSGWQLMNFAQYGYDAEAAAATLRYRAAKYHPDVVIYAAYTNDLVRNTVIYLGDKDYPVWIGSSPALFPSFLRHHSALARRVEGAWMARGLEERADPAWFQKQVADLREQSQALGAAFLVFALVPQVFAGELCEAPPDFCARHRAWAETEMRILQALQVPVIPSEPILDAAGAESFFAADKTDAEHPDPQGHRVLGEGFAATLPAALAALGNR